MNERPITPRKDAFFGFHTDLHAHSKDTVLGADVDEAMVERLIELVKPDYIQHDCKGHYGYTSCPTKIGSASPGIVKDALRIWRDVTKRHGVALCCHYSGVRDMAVLKSHPEWGAINEDGVPNQIDTSTFSSYVDDFMIPQLEEIIANYDLDGVWVDGDCWAAKFDICPSAVEEFKCRTGLSKIPPSEGRSRLSRVYGPASGTV